MKVLWCVLLAVWLLPFTASAADEHPKEFYDPDVQRLITTEVFVFGHEGRAGAITDGEKAFAALVKKSESVRYFLAAFDAGNAEARCYALIALRELSDVLYEQCDETFRSTPPANIRSAKEGVLRILSTAKVNADIRHGVYKQYYDKYEKER